MMKWKKAKLVLRKLTLTLNNFVLESKLKLEELYDFWGRVSKYLLSD